MIKNRMLGIFFGVFLCTLFTQSALADCVPSATVYPVVFSPRIVLKPDLPVGSVLTKSTLDYTVTCDRTGMTNSNESSWQIYFAADNISFGGPVAGLTNVVPTGMPGIGMRWLSAVNNSSTWMSGTAFNDTSKYRVAASPGTGKTVTTFSELFELIKTGPMQAGDQEINIPDINFWRKSNYGSYQPSGNLFTIVFSSFNIVNPSCTIDDTNIQVYLGQIHTSRFSGINSTSDTTDFAINLTCGVGTRVNLTLSNLNALSGFTGTIKLEGNDAAKGIGIQIVDASDTPVPLGTRQFVATATSPKVSIPLGARYIQTEPDIVPGPANAVLVFTINYI